MTAIALAGNDLIKINDRIINDGADGDILTISFPNDLMTVKNDALRYFLLDFPLILIAELPRMFYMAIFAPDVLMGLKDLALGFIPALNKRKLIRKRRIIDDTTLRSWFIPQRIQS